MSANERLTPETDAEERRCHGVPIGFDLSPNLYVSGDFARKLERERDDFRGQIQSSSINTNVRLFDLVRHQRAALHEDELITDEEYAWLCGSEMAMSPQGGSPSPRRLEDYDRTHEQLEAMRSAIKDAAQVLEQCAKWPSRCDFSDLANTALAKLQQSLKP